MRVLLPSFVVVGLAAASVAAVCNAVADETVAEVNLKLYEAGKERLERGVMLDDATWSALESEAKLAVRLAAQNAHYWNALARVNYEPRTINGSPVSPDYRAAYAASTKAVVVQPSSGYTWASLLFAADHLFVQNQLPGGLLMLERALSRAAALGPREPYVSGVVVDLGLANWPTLGVAAKASVRRSIEQLVKSNPDNVLAIASRRGAVSVVCASNSLAKHPVCQQAASPAAPTGLTDVSGLQLSTQAQNRHRLSS